MLFSFIVVVLVAAIAYFHYTQGLFSATISAICAALAAVLAVSYHETIIYSFLGGKVANYAHALVLIALFALIYLLLRVVFDSLIPGNLRFPTMVDRIGAAVMGLVAGIFAVGIFAIAAQALPFGPSIAMYARYKTEGRTDVQIPTHRQAEDAYVYDVLTSEEPGTFDPEEASGLILPVDEMVVNLTDKLSGGALAGKRKLADVHPSLLDELFAQRLGIQVGANRVAYNVKQAQQVTVQGLYTIDQLATADSEHPSIRSGARLKNVPEILKPRPDQMLLIARVAFGRGADDEDHNVRFSPGSIRLVAGGKNYHPIGTLDAQQAFLRVNRLDDFIVMHGERAVDLVFQLDRADLGLAAAPARRGGADAAPAETTVGEDVFIEVKRMGVVDLAGKPIDPNYRPDPGSGPFRKRELPLPKSIPQPQAVEAAAAPIADIKAAVSDKLFTRINTNVHEDNTQITLPSGTVTLRDTKFSQLDINASQTVQLLSQGEVTVEDFAVPPGVKMVHITGRAVSDAPHEPWSWADNLAGFTLIDESGTQYKPHGGWAKLLGSGGSQRMVAKYDMNALVNDIAREEGRPTEVWIAFLVPVNTKLKELQYQNKTVAPIDLPVQ